MIWSAIDRQITDLMMHILETGPDQAAILNTGLCDLAPRCTVIERLLIVSSYEEDWVDWLCSMIAIIRDELGPSRNRYVHDQWQVGVDAMRKIDTRAKLRKPKAFSRKTIGYDEPADVAIATLQSWCFKGMDVHSALSAAIHDLRYWHLSERPLEAHKQDFLGQTEASYQRYGPAAS